MNASVDIASRRRSVQRKRLKLLDAASPSLSIGSPAPLAGYSEASITITTNTQITIASGQPDISKTVTLGLADSLCAEHPLISTDKNVLGGMPHIANTRLSVGRILAKLYTTGSIEAVIAAHAPHLSVEQVKAAIAYAQDFLEAACEPNKPSQVNG